MKIIVLARPNDSHTAPIKWALEQAGYQVVCWGGLSWIEQEQASLYLDDGSRMRLGPHTVESGDTIWIRRPYPPKHNPKVSEEDRKFAEGEYRALYECIVYMLEALPVRCVNKYSAYRFIKNKSVQLHLARTCGLKIPRALMSNSPCAVRDLIDHNRSRTIWKAFTAHVWNRQSAGGVAITETFEITRDQLPEDEILTYSPGIYQDMVVKEFDVRTVLMGDRVFSFALHNPEKALDWRQDAGEGKVKVEAIATPPEVERGIVRFAKKAGVCFGSIDFAVDAEGAWWFLEINEQGQFLWLDESNRNAGIQEKFCAFLTTPEGSNKSLEERAAEFPSFGDYLGSAARLETKDIDGPGLDSPYISWEP